MSTILLCWAGLAVALVALGLRLSDARHGRTERGRLLAWGRLRTHVLFVVMYVLFLLGHLSAAIALAVLSTVNDLVVRWQIRRTDEEG